MYFSYMSRLQFFPPSKMPNFQRISNDQNHPFLGKIILRQFLAFYVHSYIYICFFMAQMHHYLEQVIAKQEIISRAGRVLVGVSGGADSVVLAHLLHKAGVKIGIAHCHFNLRGADADEDQIFSHQLARDLGVPFFTTKFETDTYAKTRKVSIQMAARNLRYFWFEKLCKEEGFQHIAVGTHLIDNIETFIFNAAKGTGLSGLRGIKPVNKNVIRPLITVTKSEIYTYANQHGLSWREDVSNQSLKYHRNKIRHKVLPVLEEINPNFEATFQRNFNRLSRVDAFVQNQINTIWESWATPNKKGFILSISEVKNHPFADVVLQYKLQPFGFNITQVADLLQALSSQPGSIISSKDYHIYVDRTEIFIQPKRFFSIPDHYLITEFLGQITQPISAQFTHLHRKDVSFSSHKNTAYFDFEALQFPLTLRKWKNGDRIHPFGMKGVKKVSDLLIDAKIPLPQKDNIWVLESNNEICWVVGLRSSERFKVTENTERVYSVELNE